MNVKCEKVVGSSDYIITETRQERCFPKMWKFKTVTEQYRGSCTVWRSYPSGVSCCLDYEMWLTDILAKHKWGEQEERRKTAKGEKS